MQKQNREYAICKAIAEYMKLQYPKILFRFDLAGLNLSKSQAGMNKCIQWGKGWPDLTIMAARGGFNGLCLEIKKEGTAIYRKDGITPCTSHLSEQLEVLDKLWEAGFCAQFAVGSLDAIFKINDYFKKP